MTFDHLHVADAAVGIHGEDDRNEKIVRLGRARPGRGGLLQHAWGGHALGLGRRRA